MTEGTSCPFCFGEIDPQAVKCRHCGEWVKAQPSTAAAPVLTPTRAEPVPESRSNLSSGTGIQWEKRPGEWIQSGSDLSPGSGVHWEKRPGEWVAPDGRMPEPSATLTDGAPPGVAMTAAGRSGDNRAKDAVAAIVVSAVAFSIIGALIVYFSEWLYPGSTGLIDHATPHSGGNGSGVYVLAAAAVLVVALRVAALRKAAGLAIIVLGVMACSSGIGALLGVPMILVGGVMLFV